MLLLVNGMPQVRTDEQRRQWYQNRLLDPRWQRKKTAIQQRADFKCEDCGADDRTLHVHHKTYESGREPWDYPDEVFVCCCDKCHDQREAVVRASRAIFQEIDPQVATAFLTALMTCGLPLTPLAGELMVYVAKDKAAGGN